MTATDWLPNAAALLDERPDLGGVGLTDAVWLAGWSA